MFLIVIALMDVAEQHYDKMVNYILTLKLKQTFLMNNFKRHLHQQMMTQYQTKGKVNIHKCLILSSLKMELISCYKI